jgi:hypothetical protein
LTIRQSTFHEKHTRINHRGVHWSTIMDSPASLLPSGTHNPSSGWLIAESQSTDRTWHEHLQAAHYGPGPSRSRIRLRS